MARRTKNFADVIRAKLKDNPDLAEGVEEESFSADLAMNLYRARVFTGLTQKQLADRAGTLQSVISRLEDADYDGHSLNLLRRIARALGGRLRIDIDLPGKRPLITLGGPPVRPRKQRH